MILDIGSLMFNMNPPEGGTPSWGTDMGQGAGYKFNFENYESFLASMVYKKIDDAKNRVFCPLGKGGKRQDDYEYVLASLFDKVFVNGYLVPDASFVLLIVKQIKNESGNHINRRTLKYSKHITLDGKNINEDCFNKIIGFLGLNGHSAWFINRIYMVNQDELHFDVYVADAEKEMHFDSNDARKRKVLQLIKDDTIKTNQKINGDKTLKLVDRIYPLNSILYGPPGTGKTYHTIDYCMGIIENKKVDIFLEDPDNRSALFSRFKSYVDCGQIVFTTFHQNYSYEDFIQGLRPKTNVSNLEFELVDGVFKKICNEAIIDPNNNYCIVIDEINRANISKVFGELITLIEEDKRYGESNAMKLTLPSGQSLEVPNNLYIVGTMNSADKSISLIDTALRRRFEFIEVPPNYSVIKNEVLRNVLISINKELKKAFNNTDCLIGHAYFINKDETDMVDVMNNKVVPLLYEYFYDNTKKIYDLLKISLNGLNYEIVNEDVGRIKIKEVK